METLKINAHVVMLSYGINGGVSDKILLKVRATLVESINPVKENVSQWYNLFKVAASSVSHIVKDVS